MVGRSLLLLATLLYLLHAKLLQAVALLAPGAHYHTNDLYDGG